MKSLGALVLVLWVTQAAAADAPDFGVRMVPRAATNAVAPLSPEPRTLGGSCGRAGGCSPSMSSAIAITARFGRVTSTFRSPAHNRAVGGARASYHLSGRAIDVVPRRGVRHRDIEVALLDAGYRLRESLNEGDHSHFAFDFQPRHASAPAKAPVAAPKVTGETQWRVVYAPRSNSRLAQR